MTNDLHGYAVDSQGVPLSTPVKLDADFKGITGAEFAQTMLAVSHQQRAWELEDREEAKDTFSRPSAKRLLAVATALFLTLGALPRVDMDPEILSVIMILSLIYIAFKACSL